MKLEKGRSDSAHQVESTHTTACRSSPQPLSLCCLIAASDCWMSAMSGEGKWWVNVEMPQEATPPGPSAQVWEHTVWQCGSGRPSMCGTQKPPGRKSRQLRSMDQIVPVAASSAWLRRMCRTDWPPVTCGGECPVRRNSRRAVPIERLTLLHASVGHMRH